MIPLLKYHSISREKLIREIARYPLAQQRIGEADQALKQLDADLDVAVAQHARDCEPVQLALAEIEDAMIAGRPHDEQQRKNLRAQVEQANVILEAKRDDINLRKRV